MTARYGTSDGTTWPVIVTDEDNYGIEWRLRYASPLDLSKEDRLFLASVVAAYRSLTDPRTVAPREKFARARRAVASCTPPDPESENTMTPEQREAMLSPAAAWFERDMPIGGTDAESAAALFDKLTRAGFSISLASVRDHTNCETCGGSGMEESWRDVHGTLTGYPCPGGSPVVWSTKP